MFKKVNITENKMKSNNLKCAWGWKEKCRKRNDAPQTVHSRSDAHRQVVNQTRLELLKKEKEKRV